MSQMTQIYGAVVKIWVICGLPQIVYPQMSQMTQIYGASVKIWVICGFPL